MVAFPAFVAAAAAAAAALLAQVAEGAISGRCNFVEQDESPVATERCYTYGDGATIFQCNDAGTQYRSVTYGNQDCSGDGTTGSWTDVDSFSFCEKEDCESDDLVWFYEHWYTDKACTTRDTSRTTVFPVAAGSCVRDAYFGCNTVVLYQNDGCTGNVEFTATYEALFLCGKETDNSSFSKGYDVDNSNCKDDDDGDDDSSDAPVAAPFLAAAAAAAVLAATAALFAA